MIEFDFMKCEKAENIKKDIRREYELGIDGTTLSDDKYMTRCLRQVFEKATKVKMSDDDVVNLLMEDEEIEDEEKKEKARQKKEVLTFEKRIPKIRKLIYSLESYSDDLLADTYMGLLRTDSIWDVEFDFEMECEWEKQAQNPHIDVECARKHYPYAAKRDFPNESIPGGCEAYHRLMLQQKNIGIFDVSMNTESLQRYAYQKTNEIYQELKKEPVENLILSEATLGIEYTNLIFSYTKSIADVQQLERLMNIIRLGLKIKPIFLREKIVDEVWKYIRAMAYSEEGIAVVEKTLAAIEYEVNRIYRYMLQFFWSVYYLAYTEGKVKLHAISGVLKECFTDYFNARDIYLEEIENSDIRDWRGITCIEDCFACINFERYSLAGDLLRLEEIQFESISRDNVQFWARGTKNLIGSKIRARALEEMYEIVKLPDTDDEKREILYGIEDRLFNEMKEAETGVRSLKDPKASAKHLKPFHVYAMVHAYVVRYLN